MRRRPTGQRPAGYARGHSPPDCGLLRLALRGARVPYDSRLNRGGEAAIAGPGLASGAVIPPEAGPTPRRPAKHKPSRPPAPRSRPPCCKRRCPGASADPKPTPGGRPRTGCVPARCSSSAAPRRVTRSWSGPTSRPAHRSPAAPKPGHGRADLARGVAIAGLAVTLIVVGPAGRRVLNRRRLATWDTDWLATKSRWSPRW